MSTKLITLPDTAAIVAFKKKVDYFLEMVRSMPVNDAQQNEFAAQELRSLLKLHSDIDAARKVYTEPLNTELDAVNASYMPLLKLLRSDKKTDETAESIIKGKMIAFTQEQERLAREARQRAEEEARIERERLEAEAAEQRRVAEAAEAEAARARGKKARAEAEERARQANAAAAAAETTAAVVTAQPVMVAPARAAGISTPETADYELEDQLSLMKHIVEHRPDLAPLFELVPAKMRAHLKMQGLATVLPGVRVFRKIGITVR